MTIEMMDYSKQSIYGNRKADFKLPFILIWNFSQELLTGSNLQGIPPRYRAILEILVNNQCPLTEAMRQFGIPRNMLRDYISICKLEIDAKR